MEAISPLKKLLQELPALSTAPFIVPAASVTILKALVIGSIAEVILFIEVEKEEVVWLTVPRELPSPSLAFVSASSCACCCGITLSRFKRFAIAVSAFSFWEFRP